MGTVTRPAPVKLICGFIFSRESAYLAAKAAVEKRHGKADFESDPIPFTFTDHYAAEMGASLTRRFCSFPRLIDPADIAPIKLRANRTEARLAENGRRRVNIDPGYVDMARLVLASTKDFRHRIYLGRGIHAEVTLFYQHGTFRPGELTYPDYRTERYIAIFNRIRELYAAQITRKDDRSPACRARAFGRRLCDRLQSRDGQA